MPKEYQRHQRVAIQIQRCIATIIQQNSDPRLVMVTVSDVEVSRDLYHATIFVTMFTENDNDGDFVKTTLSILNHAVPSFRYSLGKMMRLRKLPELRFVYDDTIKRGSHIASLLAEALAK